MVNQLANDWKKWSFDQPVMDRNMWNSDWMGSWPTAGNSRWVLLRFFMLFFLICKKLTCNFQEKCFFRARTVVCAHASFRVAFCFSCNCRWTRYDLQQTVPYLGLKKSGQNIQSVAYTLIYNHIEKITDSSLMIYIPLRRWADLVTASTVSDSWSWIQPKFVQLWHVTCVNIPHMFMIIPVSSDHLCWLVVWNMFYFP
jgi:hypothetical protein